jgi:hypothetical protein
VLATAAAAADVAGEALEGALGSEYGAAFFDMLATETVHL